MALSEFEIIDRFFRPLSGSRDGVRVGIGDDAAVYAPPAGREMVLTTDTLIADVHFPKDAPPRSVGHKALAVNLSDLAAMGSEPVGALLSVTTPDFDEAWLTDFCAGFGALAAAHNVALVGGDTTRGPMSITVQALGTVAQGLALRRDGARPGDVILVSGTLGDAALGLTAWQAGFRQGRESLIERLHYPHPRIALGAIAGEFARAGIDISDGLLADLGHILERSEVGARVDVDAVPTSETFRQLCPADRRLHYTLSWGDDYELCLCVPPEAVSRILASAHAGGHCLTRVGRITADRSLELVDGRGKAVHIPGVGYQHFGDDGGAA